MANETAFDWSELAFSSKKPFNELEALFIAAPREISGTRFKQLIRTYLPKGNIIVGLAKEDYVAGFEGQPQFRTLQSGDIQRTIDAVNHKAVSSHKIFSLQYAQADLVHILEKCNFKQVVLVNGSWLYAFHTTKPYYMLANRSIPYDRVSPFADETEARQYAADMEAEILRAAPLPLKGSVLSEADMMQAAAAAARHSYDYNFQTGVALGKRKANSPAKYTFIAAAHNKVVPYETFAMHHGAVRETNFSPPHDLNHYDTVHAEVSAVITAAKKHLDLTDTSLFINLLPCPTCSRMLADTPIKEFIYSADHSNGYAVAMLEAAHKTVRRVVPPDVVSNKV